MRPIPPALWVVTAIAVFFWALWGLTLFVHSVWRNADQRDQRHAAARRAAARPAHLPNQPTKQETTMPEAPTHAPEGATCARMRLDVTVVVNTADEDLAAHLGDVLARLSRRVVEDQGVAQGSEELRVLDDNGNRIGTLSVETVWSEVRS